MYNFLKSRELVSNGFPHFLMAGKLRFFSSMKLLNCSKRVDCFMTHEHPTAKVELRRASIFKGSTKSV